MRTVMVGALCAIAMVANANAAIREEPVTYTDGETAMKGFVVYDDAIEAKRPGIVMVHEWWGITKHIHSEARKFAQQGYTAFIADMYGDAKTADNPKDAGALSGSVMKNPTVMESRFNAAPGQLPKQASVNPQRIAAVGYCFGGADDPFVKREQYDALKKDFDAAKADYRVIEYPGAVHAFTNPEATELGKKFNLPLRYDAKVDQEAKAEAAKFFAADLQK